jgi:hypothetical protein
MATTAIVGGLAVAGIGAGLSASSASKQRKALAKQAKTPFIDPIAYQNQAIQGTLAGLPDFKKISGDVNLFNQQQLLGMQRMAIPGFDAMRDQAGTNILAMLKGELPADVAQAVTRSAAGKAIAGGFGGSQLAGSLGLRDLGITSLQTMQQGLSAAERWIASSTASSVPQLHNLAQMFFTPAQLYQGALQQRGQNMGVGTQAAMAAGGAEGVIGGFLGNLGGMVAGGGMQSLLRPSAGSSITQSPNDFTMGDWRQQQIQSDTIRMEAGL